MRFFKKRREKKKHQREVRQIVDEQIEIMVEEMNQFMAHGDGNASESFPNELFGGDIETEIMATREKISPFEWQAEMMAMKANIQKMMFNVDSEGSISPRYMTILPRQSNKQKYMDCVNNFYKLKKEKIIEQTLHRWQTENVSVEQLFLAKSALDHYLTGNETPCSWEFQIKRSNMLEMVLPFLDSYRKEVLFPLIAKVHFKKKEIRVALEIPMTENEYWWEMIL